MPAASLHLLRMADLQLLAIPGQNKVPRKGVRFSRFEHSSAAMLWEWEARPPDNWLLRTGRVDVDGQEMLLCVVDADCQPAVAMCEELLPPTPWTVDTEHGRHYYYLTTEISSQRIMGGLDRKCGRNVYVVAPGTPGYVQSAEWGHGWPPTFTMRQWMVLEQTWLDQLPEPNAPPGGHHSTGQCRKRRPVPQPGRQQQLAQQSATVRASPHLRRPPQHLPAPSDHVQVVQLATQGRPLCQPRPGLALPDQGQ
jgi:hypothetical protein